MSSPWPAYFKLQTPVAIHIYYLYGAENIQGNGITPTSLSIGILCFSAFDVTVCLFPILVTAGKHQPRPRYLPTSFDSSYSNWAFFSRFDTPQNEKVLWQSLLASFPAFQLVPILFQNTLEPSHSHYEIVFSTLTKNIPAVATPFVSTSLKNRYPCCKRSSLMHAQAAKESIAYFASSILNLASSISRYLAVFPSKSVTRNHARHTTTGRAGNWRQDGFAGGAGD